MASKNLGTLTLDLVANASGFVAGMSKAERSSAATRRKLEKDLAKLKKQAALYGAALATALVAGTVALAASTASAARQVSALANRADATAQEFQRWAAAAQHVGMSQEELSKTLERGQRRIGDYLLTASGPLKAFFTEIAPRVGVTAEAFRALSGPQSLGLFVDTLQKAGLSTQEMHSQLRKLSENTIDLLPLLENNGVALNQLAGYAARTGAIMSDDLIEAGLQLNAAMELTKVSTTGLKNQIAEGMMPVLSDLSVQLFQVAEDGTAGVRMGEMLGEALRVLAAGAVTSVGALDVLQGRLRMLLAAVTHLFKGDFEAAKMLATDPWGATTDKIERYAITVERIFAAGSNGESDELVRTIVELNKAMGQGIGSAASTDASPVDTTAADAVRATLQRRLEALEDGYKSEELLLLEATREKEELLAAAREQELITEAEHYGLLEALYAEHTASMYALQEQEAAGKLEVARALFGDMSSLINSENRKLFEAGKVAAIAQATIATSQGMAEALKLGWPLGPIKAAVIGAQGFSHINSIKNTKFGGGGSISASEGLNQSQQPVAAPQETSRNIYLHGIDPTSFVQAGSLVDMLNAELGNGARLNFGGIG